MHPRDMDPFSGRIAASVENAQLICLGGDVSDLAV